MGFSNGGNFPMQKLSKKGPTIFQMSREGRPSSAKTNTKPLVKEFITAKTWKLARMGFRTGFWTLFSMGPLNRCMLSAELILKLWLVWHWPHLAEAHSFRQSWIISTSFSSRVWSLDTPQTQKISFHRVPIYPWHILDTKAQGFFSLLPPYFLP